MLPTDLTVGTLVEQDGSFLVIEERVGGNLVLTQPGGHIETGEAPEATAVRETLEEAAVREAEEETGTRVDPTTSSSSAPASPAPAQPIT